MAKRTKLTNADSAWWRTRAENMRLMLKAWKIEKVADCFDVTTEQVLEIVKEWEGIKEKESGKSD